MRSCFLEGSDALPVSVLRCSSTGFMVFLLMMQRRILRAAAFWGHILEGGLSELVGLSSQSVEEWLLFRVACRGDRAPPAESFNGEVEALRHTPDA